jgi:hypothetical protein
MMAIKPPALFSAFADDIEENGYTDEAFLARCIASLSSDEGLTISDRARAFIERECSIDSSDVSVTSAAIRSQLKGMFWKYLSTDSTRPELDRVAVEKFMIVNQRLDTWQYSPNTSGDEELLGSFKELIWNFWNPKGFPLVTCLPRLLDAGSTGPGVSVGARGEDFYTKMFSSRPTYTSDVLLQTYLDWADEHPTWSTAEFNRDRAMGESLKVQGSSLKFVPKDVRESRTIAVEPSLNMYFQLGLGEILSSRIKTFFGLDLRTQQFWNREAARVGSVMGSKEPSSSSFHRFNWTCGLATIDLKSASDSLGLKALKWALPDDLFRLLCRLRSPVASLPDGTSVELHMVSTMGNGFTFPLETMIFSCVVVAAIESYGLKPKRPTTLGASAGEISALTLPQGNPEEWGVFGDDLVVHPEIAPRVLRLLELLGFVVNSDKSFVKGPFRESCGCDFYRGHDIRPFFVKKALDTRTSLYKAFNGFLEWSTRCKVLLPNVGKLLLSELSIHEKGRKPLIVPIGEGRDAGCRVPLSVMHEFYCISDERVRRDNFNQSYKYDRLTPHAKQLRIGDGFVAVPKGSKTRMYNPEGLLLAFLRGDVRDGRISIRQSDTRYRKRGCITPNWDYIPPVHDWVRLVGSRLDMWRLEIATRALLLQQQ